MKEKGLRQIIHKISFANAKERLELFLGLSQPDRSYVLLNSSKYVQLSLMAALPDKVLASVFDNIEADEVTDLVQFLPEKRQTGLIKLLNDDLKRNVEILKSFDPESAAGLMNLDFIQVDVNAKIIEAIKRFRAHERRTGRLPVICVMEGHHLKGYLPGHELGFARPFDRVRKYTRKLTTVSHDASQDEVVDLFKLNPQNKIAVLGEKGNVLGVIYADDIIRALKEEESSDLYDFAGVNEEENVTDKVMRKVGHRYKWLIINLGTAFLAAFTVSLFDKTIAKYVLLAVYMPIVAGMGGNAGTQTLAVLVRGIALNQIDLKRAWPTLRREILAGVINGLINGLLVSSVIIIFNHDLKIAIVLGLAMVINLFVASLFGTLVPLIMKRFGKDPASSATIFITTATDVLGFLTFLGLATLILR